MINDGSIILVEVFSIGIFFLPSDNEIRNDCELEFLHFSLGAVVLSIDFDTDVLKLNIDFYSTLLYIGNSTSILCLLFCSVESIH